MLEIKSMEVAVFIYMHMHDTNIKTYLLESKGNMVVKIMSDILKCYPSCVLLPKLQDGNSYGTRGWWNIRRTWVQPCFVNRFHIDFVYSFCVVFFFFVWNIFNVCVILLIMVYSIHCHKTVLSFPPNYLAIEFDKANTCILVLKQTFLYTLSLYFYKYLYITVWADDTSWSGCWCRQQAMSQAWDFISVICFSSIFWHIV